LPHGSLMSIAATLTLLALGRERKCEWFCTYCFDSRYGEHQSRHETGVC
jgi:hypothetical protein